MNEEEKYKLLRRIFWDYNISPQDIDALLNRRVEKIAHLDLKGLYYRMLRVLKWYEVIDLVGRENINEVLAPDIIARLWPSSVKQRYEQARRILSQ